MKYKVGDKTALGEITGLDGSLRLMPYYVAQGDSGHWFTESEIDAIICKPNRNIDHLIELIEARKKEEAVSFIDNYQQSTSWSFWLHMLDEYIEPRKYPVLTSEELKAVKWLVEGGFNTIRNYNTWVETSHSGDLGLGVKFLPTANCLKSSAWITETPIDLKELLEAQEEEL